MGITLGVDIGGSTTKIAARKGAEITALLQVEAGDQQTSAYGAVGRLLSENRYSLGDVERIVLTGVGATKIEGNIYDIPTERVEEFAAIGKGGLYLSGFSEAIVVSMGTGTAFVRAGKEGCRHLGGSGVGGGMLMGLCGRFFNIHSFSTISRRSGEGALEKVDLMVSDIMTGGAETLSSNMTAANLGKLSDDAGEEDIILGIANAIIQTAGVVANFACQGAGLDKAVITGSLTALPLAGPMFKNMSDAFGVEFMIPQRAVFATAIGACSV